MKSVLEKMGKNSVAVCKIGPFNQQKNTMRICNKIIIIVFVKPNFEISKNLKFSFKIYIFVLYYSFN